MPRFQEQYFLVLSTGSRIRMVPGSTVQERDLVMGGASRSTRVLARVTAHPSDPELLGLTNLTPAPWQVDVPGRGISQIDPGKTIRLSHDVTLRIGNETARIEQDLLQHSVMISGIWTLRVTNGPLAGREYPLTPGMHCIGSGRQSDICLSDFALAAQAVSLCVNRESVVVSSAQPGTALSVRNRTAASETLAPGDDFAVNGRTFRVVNPALAAARSQAPAYLVRFRGAKGLALVTGGLAFGLLTLYMLTQNVNIVPAMLLTVSAVVPVAVIGHLVEKYDTTGISLRTLAGTFLLGGTLGIISALVFDNAAAAATGGLASIPMFAGFAEEPAKLIATCWRWKHPVYDKPMDGLILGTVSGFGFAVFETAGYGVSNLLHGGTGDLVVTLLIRSLFSPFGHSLWAGITAAAFWECGRDPMRAVRDRRFLRALLIAVGLHALWNLQAIVPIIPMVISAAISLKLYRRLLARHGYAW